MTPAQIHCQSIHAQAVVVIPVHWPALTDTRVKESAQAKLQRIHMLTRQILTNLW